MPLTFKPKKQQIHVPGFGIVQKEEFTQEHFNLLMKRAGAQGAKKDEFIKQYFVVDSYGDQELFKEAAAPLEPPKKKTKAELKAEKDAEEAALLAQMEAEEAANKSQNESDAKSE